MELEAVLYGSAGKRRRSTEEEEKSEKPGDGNRTMKDSKTATAQVGEMQEEIGGAVNESEVCERKRGESERRA
jgi:hypothetical protein